MSRFGLGLVTGFCVGFWAVCRWLWLPPERRGQQGVRLDLTGQAPSKGGPQASPGEVIGYCVRCRTKRPMVHVERTTTKRGQPAYRGECSACGTAMFRLLPRSG